MDNLDETIWISWEQHRRTRNIAAALGVTLYEFNSNQPRWLRHPQFVVRTVGILLRRRPHTLIVQNPSVFLTLLAIALKPLFRFRLVVDAHNAGVYPCEPSHERYARAYPFIHKATDLTIVTNTVLAERVTANGGSAIELIDPLPNFDFLHDHVGEMQPPAPSSRSRISNTLALTNTEARASVTYICTFAEDEPYEEVFRAAEYLQGKAILYITGNAAAHHHRFTVQPPENVIFTGFLPEAQFIDLLRRSDVIVDLTKLPDCLVCGGYEGAALGIPLVLSDTPANRLVFGSGTVLVANKAAELAQGIAAAHARGESLRSDVQLLRNELSETWDRQFKAFRRWLQNVGKPDEGATHDSKPCS